MRLSHCELRVTGGTVVSVHTGEERASDVLVSGGRIRALVPPDHPAAADETIDATGCRVVPGYVDAHMHVESSFLPPAAFAWLTVPRGTTTVLADPHELGNVAGGQAVRWMIEQGAGTAQTMLWAVPSCVPSAVGLETAGAELSAGDIAELLRLPGVAALGELMDYRSVVSGDARMGQIAAAARDAGMPIDGHCPNLTGLDLCDYLWAGADSDHTKNSAEAAAEKARLGMMLMLQEKCLDPELIAHLMSLPLRPPFCLVTDDRAADAIAGEGHLDHIGRAAVRAGMPPLEALRALTLVPAQRLRLHDRGAVRPGLRADLLVVPSLAEFTPSVVVTGGRVAAVEGRSVAPEPGPPESPFASSVRIGPLTPGHLEWRVDLPDGDHDFRALRVNPADTSTTAEITRLPVRGGVVGWAGHTAIAVVFERHSGSGRATVVPVTGFALQPGAVATTYAHDSHNLLVVAATPEAGLMAANTVIDTGGGICVVDGHQVTAALPLPIGGVMSDRPAAEVAAGSREVRRALRQWGWDHANPFMSVATLTLPVSPAIKLTDRGLVDVTARRLVPATAGDQHTP